MIELIKDKQQWKNIEWLDPFDNNPRPTIRKYPFIYYTESVEFDSFHGGGYSTESVSVSRIHKIKKSKYEWDSHIKRFNQAYFEGFKAAHD